jgi:hypothetical protein
VSEQLYNHLTGLLIGIAILFMTSFVGMTFILIVFLIATQYLTYIIIASLVGCGVALAVFLFYVRVFRRDVNLYVPDIVVQNDKPLPLELDVEGLPLKVCQMYHNGFGYVTIAQKFRLDHANEAKRQLVKGLGILLESYGEHNHE